MSSRTMCLSEELYEYMKRVSLREPDVLRRLREETARDPMHMMQISPEQGQFMALLVKLMGATAHWRWVSIPATARLRGMALPENGRSSPATSAGSGLPLRADTAGGGAHP